MDLITPSGEQMTVSAHQKIELNQDIVPELRKSGAIMLLVPSVGGEDIVIDITHSGDVEFLSWTQASSTEGLFQGGPRRGTLEVHYMYRDGNNFKQFAISKFTGEITDFRACVIYTALVMEDEETFIPENLSIKPLQDRWSTVDYSNEGADHPYHELELLSFKPEVVDAQVDGTIEDLHKICLAALKDKYPPWK
jgi:hypothetical protein